MSGEQSIGKQLNKRAGTHSYKKVNINTLLFKVREQKTRERNENYMFVGLEVVGLEVAGLEVVGLLLVG